MTMNELPREVLVDNTNFRHNICWLNHRAQNTTPATSSTTIAMNWMDHFSPPRPLSHPPSCKSTQRHNMTKKSFLGRLRFTTLTTNLFPTGIKRVDKSTGIGWKSLKTRVPPPRFTSPRIRKGTETYEVFRGSLLISHKLLMLHDF